jgi:beta-glucosidase
MKAISNFPRDFVWGVATSAYQIEGSTRADGRSPSIWDHFAARPGAIEDKSNGDVACDHYVRWQADITLMKELGVRAYRFSVAWPRVLPAGRGPVNLKGLDFYSRLVDGLLEAGIEPFLTLFHWDLPQVLEEAGGWPVRATAEAFVEYAEAVTRRLGDRVKRWITHNEPWCSSMLGYHTGRHAPGRRSLPEALAASHHLLLSHGWAVAAIRAHSPGADVGITLNLTPAVAASSSAADRDATRHFDGYFNRWFLDPVHGRGYPEDMIADYVRDGTLAPAGLEAVRPGDLEAIAARCDFLGVNYYNRTVVRSTTVPEGENAPREVFLAPESEWTDMGWEVFPAGLHTILTRVHADYAPPRIYVTENGASFGSAEPHAGRVADAPRVRFLRDHFLAAKRAIDDGVPLAGFFVWSLLDNFEWERGYTQRFGIVSVDYPTQIRSLKESARFYRRVIADGGVG